MKTLRFPNDNTLILLNKGGSTHLGWMIKLYCDWKGIPIRHNTIGGGKIIMVIRNPFYRFLSGFLHRYTITTPSLWKDDEEMMSTFSDWMRMCWSGEIESPPIDYHIWRAGSILEREGLEIDTFIKVEELGKEMERWASIRKGAREPEWDIPHSPIPSPPAPLLVDIGLECEGWDTLMWAGLWHLSNQNVKGHHRSEETKKLLQQLNNYPQLLLSAQKWVEEDMWRLGYQKWI